MTNKSKRKHNSTEFSAIDVCVSIFHFFGVAKPKSWKEKVILNSNTTLTFFPTERMESGAVGKFVINHVANARRAHFAP